MVTEATLNVHIHAKELTCNLYIIADIHWVFTTRHQSKCFAGLISLNLHSSPLKQLPSQPCYKRKGQLREVRRLAQTHTSNKVWLRVICSPSPSPWPTTRWLRLSPSDTFKTALKCSSQLSNKQLSVHWVLPRDINLYQSPQSRLWLGVPILIVKNSAQIVLAMQSTLSEKRQLAVCQSKCCKTIKGRGWGADVISSGSEG